MIEKIKHSRTLLENAIKNGVALNKLDEGNFLTWYCVCRGSRASAKCLPFINVGRPLFKVRWPLEYLFV